MLHCTISGFRNGADPPFSLPLPRNQPAGRVRHQEKHMFQNFDEIQKISKETADIAVKNFGTVSKGVQAIAIEVADYQKKTFEQGTAAVEKLLGARTLDKVIETQTDYFKNSYEGFVAQAKKIGDLYADLAKETYKPVESAIAKAK
jgi:hypothetical protein